MKKLFYIAPIALLLSLLPAACSKDEATTEAGEGRAAFVCEPDLSVEALTRAEEGRVQLPISPLPAAGTFKLTITPQTGTPLVYAPFSTYDQPMLAAGNYTAVFELGDPEAAESSTAYCFRGEAAFTIRASKTETVTVAPKLINSALRLQTTEWFDLYYSEAEFTVSTASNNSFLFTPTSGQTIYVKAGTKIRLRGKARKQNGVTVAFPEHEIGVTKATTLHTIRIDASEAGRKTIRITLGTVDDMIEVPEEVIELNPEA